MSLQTVVRECSQQPYFYESQSGSHHTSISRETEAGHGAQLHGIQYKSLQHEEEPGTETRDDTGEP